MTDGSIVPAARRRNRSIDRIARTVYCGDCDTIYEDGMTFRLNPEQEQLLGQAIQAGVIRVPDEVVEVGIETIRQRLEARRVSGTAMDAEEWSRELHAWVHSHPTTTPLLSDEAISRDSIYGTRGL